MLSKTALKWSTTYLLRLLRRKLAKSFAAASNPVVDLSKNAETKSGGMVFDLLLWWKQTQKKQTKKEKIPRIGTMHNGGDTNTHSKYTWCGCTGAPWRRPILNASCCTWCASMTSLEIHRNIWSHGDTIQFPNIRLVSCELVDNWGKTPYRTTSEW